MRREIWEHRGLLIGLTILASLVAIGFIVVMFHSHIDGAIMLYTAASVAEREAFAGMVLHQNFAPRITLLVALGMMVFFYRSSALHDDRRNGSLLFWRSLPISDAKVVWSKVAIVLIVAPLIIAIYAVAITALSMLIGSLLIAFHGVNGFSALFGFGKIYGALFNLLTLWPAFVLTVLPTFGWMFFISALVRNRPMIWIINAPIFLTLPHVLIAGVFKGGSKLAWLQDDFATRLIMGVLPGSWVKFRPSLSVDTSAAATFGGSLHELVSQGWKILAYGDYWIAAAIGIALIFVAIRLRRWRVDA